MKIKAFFAAAALSCVMLTGCGHEHQWQEATCTEPQTCTVCGETQGETAEHTWTEATCTEPKTCSVCGLTEGEALGHTFTEATYQSPATCTVCGATEGEALTPAFVEHGVKGQFMEPDQTYDYYTHCYEDRSKTTVGKATVSDYRTFASDDTHEAKEGYEWKTLTMTVVYSDNNVNQWGVSTSNCYEDYYDIVGHDQSTVFGEGDNCTFTVQWNGQDYAECKQYCTLTDDWPNETLTKTYEYEVLLPVGYDGYIVGLRDSGNQWQEGQYIFDIADDNTLFFRLQ